MPFQETYGFCGPLLWLTLGYLHDFHTDEFNRKAGNVKYVKFTFDDRGYIHRPDWQRIRDVLKKLFRMGQTEKKKIIFSGFAIDKLKIVFQKIDFLKYADSIVLDGMTGSAETLYHMQNIPMVIHKCSMTGVPLPSIEGLRIRVIDGIINLDHTTPPWRFQLDDRDVIKYIEYCRIYGMMRHTEDCVDDLCKWARATAVYMFSAIEKAHAQRIFFDSIDNIDPTFIDKLKAMIAISKQLRFIEEVSTLTEFIKELRIQEQRIEVVDYDNVRPAVNISIDYRPIDCT